jgi:hypothetical protein
MNKKLHEMALQIGGSHYPEVSRQYFEPTVRLVVQECADKLGVNPATLLEHFELDK